MLNTNDKQIYSIYKNGVLIKRIFSFKNYVKWVCSLDFSKQHLRNIETIGNKHKVLLIKV